MPGLIEYRLNLDEQIFRFTGSGKVLVYGTASTFVIPVTGVTNLGGFDVNEYAYDSNHQIWHITGLIGSPDGTIAQAEYAGITAEIPTSELLSFEPGSYYFTVEYLNDIGSYQNQINVIDNKIDSLPPEITTEYPYYVEMPAESNYSEDSENSLTDTKTYEQDISSYENEINDINNIINNLPTPVPDLGNVIYLEIPEESSYVDDSKSNIYTTMEYSSDISKYESSIDSINARLEELGAF